MKAAKVALARQLAVVMHRMLEPGFADMVVFDPAGRQPQDRGGSVAKAASRQSGN